MGFFENKKEMVVAAHHHLFTIVQRFDFFYVGLGDCAIRVYFILRSHSHCQWEMWFLFNGSPVEIFLSGTIGNASGS
jgi:hypothetical protein